MLQCYSFRSILEQKITFPEYTQKFKTLLWTEEIQMEKDIKRYDLVGVDMERKGNLLVLEVMTFLNFFEIP